MPYTYLIGWSKQNKWYYGCRFAKNCQPNDLWKTYFTSSKYVKQFREKHGEPDVIEIRKIFLTPKEAVSWELKVLQKMNILNEDKWLNRNICGNFKASESYPNIYKNKKLPTDWVENIKISSNKFWQSEKGNIQKLKHSEHAKNNDKFTTKGLTAHNKIKETLVLHCEFCNTKVELARKKYNINKKTCGSKSCAAKWSNKYKKESYNFRYNGAMHLNFKLNKSQNPRE